MHENILKPEKAILVALGKKGADRELAFDHLNELESLAETAGADVIEKFYQELDKANPKTAIGKGKVEEIALAILENDINLVIFDDDLTPVQNKNLGNELKVKVIDRSGLILDIFAKHAKSLEAKTQVELAQLQYMLPRLTRLWTHLSKQFGGIGTKGPGETQIETDRRIVRLRIQKLQDKLVEISTQKEQQRKSRVNIPKFALVGYTNAGKSTLMNIITDADVYVEDKLFATLDTTVRSFNLPAGKTALLSDTVGFIRKLPTHLIASFRSTLAEASEADVLIHIVDVSHPYFKEHIEVVKSTLDFLKISEKPIILIFNKVDLLDDRDFFRVLEQEYPGSIFISAKRGINILKLLEFFQTKVDEFSTEYRFVLPYSSMELVSKLYKVVDIIERADKDNGIHFKVKVNKENKELFAHQFRELVLQKNTLAALSDSPTE